MPITGSTRLDIKDEGSPRGPANGLNFTGSGVSATVDSAGIATVNIPGGGGGGASLASGTATLDFGAFPGGSDTNLAITGQSGIVAESIVLVSLRPADTADHSADEHLAETLQVQAGNIIPGVGFTIYAKNTNTLNEPLENPGLTRFRSAATSIYGYTEPSQGGRATRIYGQWTVHWLGNWSN